MDKRTVSEEAAGGRVDLGPLAKMRYLNEAIKAPVA